jgi:hypothetical protein
MTTAVLLDLEHNRKRLSYYTSLKEKSAKAVPAIQKWIEIYSERVTKLERQLQKAQKLGLKTQMPQQAPAAKRA